MIDLTNKSFVIVGKRGGGKSWLTKHILDSTPSHLVYDPLGEHIGYRQYIPTDRESPFELDEVIKGMVIPWRPALFIIDEANKYVPAKPRPMPPGVSDLNDFARHWGISAGYICRRPVQFHTDIVELANYVFFFKLTGRNDYQYMEDLHEGLGDKVRALKPFQFVILEDGDKIVTTTLHKFFHLLRNNPPASLTHDFAVIIDEAHSSYGNTLQESL